MRTIFRKSTNTNSFGLRGYWAYCPTSFELHSFASSQNLAIGSKVNPFSFEIPRFEGVVIPAKRKQFLQTVTQILSE